MAVTRSIGIQGAAGRMGLRIVQLLKDDPDARLGAALERPDHPLVGTDVGLLAGVGALGVALGPDLPAGLDVLIDFSAPAAALTLAEVAADRGLPLVIGTTGFESEQRTILDRVAERTALLVAPNMSRAVHLLMRLVEQAASALKGQADPEVIERHHTQKKDAPSGTAARLVELIATASGTQRVVHGRQGQTGIRRRDEVGVHALRCGDNPGEHTVVFGMQGEVIELTHRAYGRDGFALGAIEAAKWIVGKPPGRYAMADVFESR